MTLFDHDRGRTSIFGVEWVFKTMIDVESISDNDVNDFVSFANRYSHIKKENVGRYSMLLLKQLTFCVHNNNDLFKVLEEINFLEGYKTSSRTKPPSQFEGELLYPLWHKHYVSGGVKGIAINVKKSINTSKDGSKKDPLNMLIGHVLNTQIYGEKKPHVIKKQDIEQKDAIKSIKNIVAGGYEQLIKNGELTGKSYIIYAKDKDMLNHYLCLADHYNGRDGDIKVRNSIDQFCLSEFPFLNDILKPRSSNH